MLSLKLLQLKASLLVTLNATSNWQRQIFILKLKCDSNSSHSITNKHVASGKCGCVGAELYLLIANLKLSLNSRFISSEIY